MTRKIERFARLVPVILSLPVLLASTGVQSAAVLDTVKANGVIRCAVSDDFAGFASSNSLGEFIGLEADLCRALAAATLADSQAVSMVAVGEEEKFQRLASGDVDVLLAATPITLRRDTRSAHFSGIYFHDGQSLLAHRRTGARVASELGSTRICVPQRGTLDTDLANYFARKRLPYKPVRLPDIVTAVHAYQAGQCDAITANRARLASIRSTLKKPASHRLLPDVLSKQPYGLITADDDAEWSAIVEWSLNCMVGAEELGVSQGTLDDVMQGTDSDVRFLLGMEGSAGRYLKLSRHWCQDVIRQVGNYQEIFERHVGPDSPLGLVRGINRLWTEGGLLYAPPFR